MLWDQLLALVQSTEKDRDIKNPPLDRDLWRRTEQSHHSIHATNLELGDVKEALRLLTDQVQALQLEVGLLKGMIK